MIDHMSIGVSDFQRSLKFYDGVLMPIGYKRLWITEKAAGWGIPPGTSEKFAIMQEESPIKLGSSPQSHIAFTANTREGVVAFFLAAMNHGGEDQGGAGLRSEYGPGYFAAYVADPDGYQIEAVCHENVAEKP